MVCFFQSLVELNIEYFSRTLLVTLSLFPCIFCCWNPSRDSREWYLWHFCWDSGLGLPILSQRTPTFRSGTSCFPARSMDVVQCALVWGCQAAVRALEACLSLLLACVTSQQSAQIAHPCLCSQCPAHCPYPPAASSSFAYLHPGLLFMALMWPPSRISQTLPIGAL